MPISILGADRRFLEGVARAFGGALIFGLPMLMTMELWQMGLYLSPWRLMALIVVSMPLLVGLSRLIGFERTEGNILRDVADALVAIAIAVVASTVVLLLFNVITFDMHPREFIGSIVLQMVPASIGALLSRSQLGDQDVEDDGDEGDTYPGELFVMVVGALFLSLNMAPTDEIVMLAHKMTLWHELVLVAVSLGIMHALVYTVEFRGGHERPGGASFISTFARFTLVGYALVLVVSLGVLWLFGRTDGASAAQTVSAMIVLAFPGAIGAAAARLVL